jgi:chorismate mutase
MKQQTLDQFNHKAGDPWRWRAAEGPDIPAIIGLIERNSGPDIQGITDINPVEGSRNLMHAIVNQMYTPKKEMVSVAVLTDTREIVAFNWAQRDKRFSWSTEEFVESRFMSIESSLSRRIRVALCCQAIRQYERWAILCELKLAVSSSMRRDSDFYMHIHERLGWYVRGSTAYKRLSTVTIEPETSRIILPD